MNDKIVMKNEVPEVAFTHSGKFHADDVFGAALLTYLNKDIKIIRGNEVPEQFEGIVFDIGGGEFDHHQPDHRVREDGTPYAAFGLLWERFGPSIVGEEETAKFDRGFVQALDLSDNTGSENQLASAISFFNPPWDSDKSMEEAFEEAKQFALAILSRKFELVASVYRAEGMVNDALSKMENHLLILPVSAPWRKYVKGEDVDFVIFPSNRGGYCAQAVPAEKEDEEQEDEKDEKNDKSEKAKSDLKFEFPENWAGLRDEELEGVSGIKGLRFCHNSRFLIATDTLEGAIEACQRGRGDI